MNQQTGARRVSALRHDLRTQLNAILGYSELWLEEAPAAPPPGFCERLREIHAGGRFLLERLNALLAPVHAPDLSAAAGGLRAGLGAPVRNLIDQSEALLATAPVETTADMHAIHNAGLKLLAMIGAAGEQADVTEAAPEAPTPAGVAGGPTAAAGGRVLVVDDNEVNRDVLSRRLAREGYAVTLAADGAEALSLLARDSFDLVLLDIMMPVMNGYEALQRIRADIRYSDLPVLMISSVDEIESVVRCIEMGAEDYLPKPFDPVLLRARVKACVERKRLREERQQQQMAEQERLRRDLEMAARVQQRLLPESAPRVAGLDLAGGCVPMRAVGGDYFDFLPLDDRHLAMAVADVAGKGMPAALVMAAIVASLRSQAHQHIASMPRLAAALNVQMYDWTDTGGFVTLFYACLDCVERRLRYVSAGHNPPVLVRASGQVLSLSEAGGLPLGVIPGATYEQAEISLSSGDVLVAYTDGVTEACNEQQEEFGETRLIQAVLNATPCPAHQIWQSVLGAVREWCAGAAQSDDITALVMKVL
jgi:sigma-B regulation protein RsbU (phosphoserine phosphatase)